MVEIDELLAALQLVAGMRGHHLVASLIPDLHASDECGTEATEIGTHFDLPRAGQLRSARRRLPHRRSESEVQFN